MHTGKGEKTCKWKTWNTHTHTHNYTDALSGANVNGDHNGTLQHTQSHNTHLSSKKKTKPSITWGNYLLYYAVTM